MINTSIEKYLDSITLHFFRNSKGKAIKKEEVEVERIKELINEIRVNEREKVLTYLNAISIRQKVVKNLVSIYFYLTVIINISFMPFTLGTLDALLPMSLTIPLIYFMVRGWKNTHGIYRDEVQLDFFQRLFEDSLNDNTECVYSSSE